MTGRQLYRTGLATTVAGLVLLAVGVVLRLAKVAPDYVVDGFVVHVTYPAARWCVLGGLAVAVVGAVVAVRGRRRARREAAL